LQEIEKDRYPNLVQTKIERVLELQSSSHFGDAFKRIQALFFMLRENEDVFDVFCKNAFRIRYHTNGSFPESLINYLFNDLTAQNSSNRLSLVIQ
jgi:hypothetical protein